MNCTFCGKEIVKTREGYYILDGLEYHNESKYAYVQILEDGEEIDKDKHKKIIDEDSKLIYCEDCYESRVNIKPG